MDYEKEIKKLQERVNKLEGKQTDLKPKKKITLQEFWDSTVTLGINCSTLEEAEKLLKAFDKIGKTWKNGNKYTEVTNYYFGSETCYYNNRSLGCMAEAIRNNIPIYDFKDIILPEEYKKEPVYKFTDDEKAILRNLPQKYKYIARDKNGCLYIYKHKPTKLERDYRFEPINPFHFEQLKLFSHLFKSIDWSNEEACEFKKYI